MKTASHDQEMQTAIMQQYNFMALAYQAFLHAHAQKVPYFTIDALNDRLFEIYMQIKTYHIEAAKHMARDTIVAINAATVENIAMGSMAIDILYRVLVDLAFMRILDARDKIRTFHDVWHECPMSMYIFEDLNIDM